MNRRLLLALAMWSAAAVVAVLTGLAAVEVIGEGITTPAGTARDPDDVARALAGAPAPQQWPYSEEPSPSGPGTSPDGGRGNAVPRDTAGAGSPGTGGPGTVDPGAVRPGDPDSGADPDSGGDPDPGGDPVSGGNAPVPRPATGGPPTGAAPGPTTRAPTGTASSRPRRSTAAPRPAATTTTLRTPGGSLVARCAGDQVQLMSWAPAQGFATHAVHRGPDDEAEIRFRGADGEVRVRVVCGRAGPVATWQVV